MDIKMKEWQLSDEEIAQEAIVCWGALQEHERRSFHLVARAAEQKLIEWGDEPCPHVHRVFATRPKRACDICWQSLVKGE